MGDNGLIKMRGERWSVPLPVRLGWRYLITGKELWGAGDNATWLHDATVDYRGRPYETLTRARWRRVARRHAGLWGTAGLLAMWATVGAWLPLGVLGALSLAAGTVYGRHLRRERAVREIRKEFVYPAAAVLAKLTGVKIRKKEAPSLIILPDGFGQAQEEGEVPRTVRVIMPAAIPLPDKLKASITSQMGAKLGLPNPSAVWVESGSLTYVELAPAALPPARVLHAEVLAMMEAAELERPLIGLANGKAPVFLDFDNDSPHTLASAGSGGGKSSTFRVLAMQRMRHGAGAVFIDYKKWSHIKWVRGLPPERARYFHRVHEMHDALCAVMEEIIRRKELDDDEELDALRTVDVYVEEINTLMPMLADYWTEVVNTRKAQARSALRQAKAAEDEDAILRAEEMIAEAMSLPKKSPALQALKYGVNLGREFRVHFHFIGQSMSANAAGGRDTRASFRTRLLASWDRADWRMLAPGIPFRVCPPGPRGLWAHVHGSEVEIVRVPWAENQEAREFVLSSPYSAEELGSILPPSLGGTPPPLRAPSVKEVEEGGLSLAAILPSLPPRRDGSLLSLPALRQASYREGFPPGEKRGAGRATLYSAADVREWFEEREQLVSIEA